MTQPTRAIALAATLFLIATANAAVEGTLKLDTGLISGAATSTPEVKVFKGIPFAAPPVGNLRWKAPQPPAKWEGVRKGDTFGPTCMQASEDCLYLNVWTNAKPHEKHPVMVWIYGGGYTTGSGSDPRYDGEMLAKKGAVVVTINYRLGVFGFFSHPDLTKESDRRAAANFGVLDSISALQWVQRNISQFGGDPKRVTIFGESAGAGMVANLQNIQQAKGLFQRAIGESSAWSTAAIAPLKTLPEAEADGIKVATALGTNSLADMRAKSAADVLKAARGAGAGPVVDGYLITEDPSKVFARGGQIAVPVLAGSNRDESFAQAPRSAQAFIDAARKKYGDLADSFLKVYPASNDEEARESAFYAGRDEMAFVMRNWARLESKVNKKSYAFFFTEQPPLVPPPPGRAGRGGRGGGGAFAPGPHGSAVHVSEVLYVFNHLDKSREWTDQDRRVADEMSSYWVNFAATGDPNGKGLAKWTPYGDKDKTPMVFGNPPEGPQAPSDERLAFFQAWFDKIAAK